MAKPCCFKHELLLHPSFTTYGKRDPCDGLDFLLRINNNNLIGGPVLQGNSANARFKICTIGDRDLRHRDRQRCKPHQAATGRYDRCSRPQAQGLHAGAQEVCQGQGPAAVSQGSKGLGAKAHLVLYHAHSREGRQPRPYGVCRSAGYLLGARLLAR